ncbi:alpha/beta fold hydrolase [Allorhizocola rhizosphaerae]|uniref:alpha/beta fold hydrolase n=1 Tax=Allorhizocola rhizosphaerae TaxID=1872709 RepID=UPI000E3E29CB|nr:alpha/beta hydrolase [Allorhizocola rhizosphaerae]
MNQLTTEVNPASYAEVNGLSLHYEEHGAGEPLILLHGGFGAAALLGPIVPALAAERRVIAVDMRGHGRTADIDRPLDPALLAEDIAALIRYLGLEQADLMGYSLGGEVALRTAIQHPALVRRLVLVSVPFARSGNHSEVIAAMDHQHPGLAEMLKPSPNYQHYARVAPRPDDWAKLVAKTSEHLAQDYDWSADLPAISATTMLVFADADSVRPAHVVDFYGLLGGGQRDAGVDGSGRAATHLAILPGTTHYDVLLSPLLAPAVAQFLNTR